MFTLFNLKYGNIIFFDLTGPTRYEGNNNFIRSVKKLSERYYIYNSSPVWGKTELHHIAPSPAYFYPLNLPLDAHRLINETGSIEANILIITNNLNNVAKWQESNFSVVFLSVEKQDYKQMEVKNLPDQIWPLNLLEAFANNNKVTVTWPNEFIGMPVSPNNYYYGPVKKFEPDYLIGETLNIDILLTGRYFTSQDVRAYSHPLTQAILLFKKENATAQKMITNYFESTLQYFKGHGEVINLITCVPPRPGKKNRFNAIKLNLSIQQQTLLPPIDFNLLSCIKDYPSPKKHFDSMKKFECVSGVFTSNTRVNGHIILIDDVLTSGVTAVECAKELFKAGASKVTIVPFGITQNYHMLLQNDMPIIKSENGAEYWLRFNSRTLMTFWGGYNVSGKDFLPLKIQYTEQNNIYSNFNSNKMTNESDLWKKDIGCIIFDLDNTLVNTEHLEVYRREKDWETCYNEIPFKTYPILNLNLIRELQRIGIKIGIVTNSPKTYAENILRHHNIPYNNLIAYHDTVRKKPFSEPLLTCLELLDVNAENCINIGDNAIDILAGNRSNISNIAVRWGDYSENDFLEVECDFFIDTPEELNDVLSKIITKKTINNRI